MRTIVTEKYKQMRKSADYLKRPDKYAPNFMEKLEETRQYLMRSLENYGLSKIDFSDVSAGGIQMSGVHKDVPGYFLIDVTINYDLSNLRQVIDEFVLKWKSLEEQDVSSFRTFTEQGNSRGWD